MDYFKSNSEMVILIGNAVLLIVGTIAQLGDSSTRSIIMSILFLAWLGLFAWRIVSVRPLEQKI